jgi:hypothetical protein
LFGFLARAIRQEKEKKIQIGKEELKFFLFTVDVLLFLKDPKDSTRKLLDLMNTFSKL